MWGRVSIAIFGVALAIALIGPGAPENAVAGHEGKDCGVLSKGSRDYRVRAQQLSCDKARKGAKRYLRSGESLTGFDCDEPDGRIEFFCKRELKVYWGVRL